MNELYEISMAMKEELRARLGSPQSSFDLWFGDFNLTSLDESKAVFSTPTKLRKQILSTRYITLIKEALTLFLPYQITKLLLNPLCYNTIIYCQNIYTFFAIQKNF